MSDLIPSFNFDKNKFPEIDVGDMVHSCGMDNYCVATVVSAIFTNYNENGIITAHIAFPAPNTPIICNNTPIKYHKPESKDDRPIRTWHLRSECIGGCKRLEAPGRIMH